MKVKMILALSFAIVGCGQENASFSTVEDARLQAKENGVYLAKTWRSENPAFQQWNILSRGDSTIMPNCPQGDGWVSVDLQHSEKLEKVYKIKCSSYSRGIGCMSKSDFEKRSQYANQEGRCNKDVPHPIPKIAM